MELWAFFNSCTQPCKNCILRYQLAGDVLNFVAYRLQCKHYFHHLTHPPSYRESIFSISTLGRYVRNAGKVGWVGIRLASVYCMTRLLHVFKNLRHITVTVPAHDVQRTTRMVS